MYVDMAMLGDAVKERKKYEDILNNEGVSTIEDWKNIARVREEMQKAVAEFKSNVESLASELAALGVKPEHIPGYYVDCYKLHLCYGPTKELNDVHIGARYVDGNRFEYYEAARVVSDNDEKRNSLDVYIPSFAKLGNSDIQNNRLFKRSVRTSKKTDEGKSIYKDVMIEVSSDFHLGIDPAKDLMNGLANLEILKDINEHWEEHKQNVADYYYRKEKGQSERLRRNLTEIDEKLSENLAGLTDEDDRGDIDV